MTPNQVARTAFKYIPPSRWHGSMLTDKDPNEMCISCKSEATERVTDAIDLRPFREFYQDRQFKAFLCPDCGARFSFTEV